MNRPVQTIRAFTLIELLAVMGIIAIRGVVITTSAQRISKDAKLAGATNKVLAALGEARAIAIRDRAMVLVGFRVRMATYRATPTSPETIDYSKPQQTEIVIAKATGRVGFPGNNSSGSWTVVYPFTSIDDLLVEEFSPVVGMAPILLPSGIKVAGSGADITLPLPCTYNIGPYVPWEDYYVSQPVFKSQTYERGSLVVVRFDSDGTLQTRNTAVSGNLLPDVNLGESVNVWIDFDRDGLIDVGTSSTGTSNSAFYSYDEYFDEPLGNVTVFLAIFDDDSFQAQFDPSLWRVPSILQLSNAKFARAVCDRTNFINQFSDRIHFNRFTGVAEVVPR